MLFSLKEYQTDVTRLADRLVWSALVAPGVVESKDGLLQTTIEFRGPDLESSTEEQLVAVTGRLNNALKRLGGGWSVFVEAQRREANEYPSSEFPEDVSRLVDGERRRMFEREGAHFTSRYFLTLVYAPPKQKQASFFGFLTEGGETDQSDPREYLSRFQDRVGSLIQLLNGVFPYVKRLEDDETLTYLHSTVSTKQHRVKAPEIPVYLDAFLTDERVESGLELKIGDRFVRTLTVQSFPSTSVPGILGALNQLQFEYRWVTRYMAYDKQEALGELKKYQKRWYSQRKGIGSVISEMVGGGGSALQNTDAVRKAEDVDAAIQEVQNDYVSIGEFTASVTLWGDTREQADERAKAVETVIQSRGFTVITEEMHSLDAWLGSHPGNVYANLRKPLIHSLNLSHMMPVSAVWAGDSTNQHLNAPPHLTAKTTGGTPFRLSTCVGDVGHTLILGPTGAGKSTLLNLLALQWLRYKDGQVIIFDKGRSSRAPTLAVGGKFYDLELSGSEVSFQPLRNVDDENERGWARDWLLEILASNGIEKTPDVKKKLWQALTELAGFPAGQRTMFGLERVVQSRDIREVLGEYTGDGPYAGLFDDEDESMDVTRWSTFEMARLMETNGAVPPTLSYLFHRVESRFDGSPTLLILDEAWMFLDEPQFAEKIREWLKVLRKKRVYVVFATQSVADAVNSDIAPVIIESCLTRILLPNNRAMEPGVAEHYRELGLNKRQVRMLAQATAKRQYYYQSPKGTRLFELGLEETPASLALVGSADPDDQKLMDEILRRSGKSEFAEEFLRAKGLAAQANMVARGGRSADVTVAEVNPDPLSKIWGEGGQ